MIKIYQVGGHVRDQLLGKNSKDIDFAVEAISFNEMYDYVKNNCKQVYLVKPEYLTIRALHNKLGAVDYVMCRKDGYYSDNRRPDSVEPGTIFDDLARRDFTVNAIAIDENNNIIDPYNGVQDIKSNILVTVGETSDRFNEDPLRILRAIRFKIVKGFQLSYSIEKIFVDLNWIPKLKSVSKERIREEMIKCFSYSTIDTLKFFDTIPFEWTEAILENMKLKPTFEDF